MQKIIALFFAFMLCGLMAWPVHVSAASIINDQGAADLKKLIESDLNWRIEMTKTIGQGIAMGGALEVVPKGTFYEVKFPKLAVIMGPNGRLDIGTVTANMTPGKDGEWLSSVALPSSMTMYGKTGAAVANITIGNQRFAGAWVPAMGMYPKLDALYQNIKFSGLGANGIDGAVGSMKMVANLNDNKDNSWSGPVSFEAGDISINTSGSNPAQVSVAKIAYANIYDRLDIGHELSFRKKIQDIYTSGKAPDEQESKELINALLFAAQGGLADNISSSFTAEKFLIREKSGLASGQPVEMSVDRLAFQGALKGARQEQSTASFKGGFDGMKISSVPADFASMTPHAANIEMSLDNLPVKKITQVMSDALQASLEGGAASAPAQARMNVIFNSLPGMLQSAGTSLSVQNTFLRSQDIDTGVSGRIDSNAASAAGVTGKMTLSVIGLENTIQKLKDISSKRGADPKMAGYAGSLTGIMLMGQNGVAADGRKTSNYAFEITPDGKLLLNGVSIQSLPHIGANRNVPPVVP